MSGLRIGFVTATDSFWHHHLLTAKQGVQWLTGAFSPDVYALPRFLGDGCRFVRTGQPLSDGSLDLIFSELNGSDVQLEYLDSLVAAPSPAVAVVPGPPEILCSRLTGHKLALVRRILRNARFVLAYSDTIASFYDGLIGQARSQVIPWPFDYDAVRRVAGPPRSAADTIRIVLNIPLRFSGRAENYPFILKAALVDALTSLSPGEQERFSFHSFMYTDQDREAFTASGFGEGLRVTIEEQRLFAPFVRFLGSCGAVVNLTSSSVLGRITFLAAALDKPGLFTSNAEFNTRLYPGSTVPLLAPAALRDALTALLRGLVSGDVPARFLPDAAAARAAGDFSGNAARFARIFSELPAARR
ncbi:MAG: hypothetical protein ABI818_04700 [Acidobacteriota bacterium]